MLGTHNAAVPHHRIGHRSLNIARELSPTRFRVVVDVTGDGVVERMEEKEALVRPAPLPI